MFNQLSLPSKADRPSLSDANVVLGLVKQFGLDVLALRASFMRGDAAATSPKDRLLDLCKRYGDIFEGRDSSYHRPDWANMTVAWMRHVVVDSGDVEALALVDKPLNHSEVGKGFFLLLAKVVMQVSDSVSEGMDQRRATARMTEVNDRFASVLMGMQP